MFACDCVDDGMSHLPTCMAHRQDAHTQIMHSVSESIRFPEIENLSKKLEEESV